MSNNLDKLEYLAPIILWWRKRANFQNEDNESDNQSTKTSYVYTPQDPKLDNLQIRYLTSTIYYKMGASSCDSR